MRIKDNGYSKEKETIRVYDALEIMLANCDGSKKFDGMGFSKFDRKTIDRIMQYERDSQNEKYVMDVLDSYTNTQLKDYDLRNEYGRAPELEDCDIVLEVKRDRNDKQEDENKKILIRFDYDEEIVDIMKQSSAEYNPETKNWCVDIDCYEKLESYFAERNYDVMDLCDL